MQLPSETVFEAALGLPENERLTLVSRLLETMPADDSAISLDRTHKGDVTDFVLQSGDLRQEFADLDGAFEGR